MKPVQYVLVGLPYSGKTTLAKELESRLGFARINIDQLKFDRGYTDVGDDDVPDTVWNEIFSDADARVATYLKQGRDLANEYAWITRSWRDRARSVADNNNAETKLIYIKLPQEIILQRREENRRSNVRFHWPDEEFRRILKDFEEPTADENVMIYDQTTSVDEWIRNNL